MLKNVLAVGILFFGVSGCLAPVGVTFDSITGQALQALPLSSISLKVTERLTGTLIFDEVGRNRNFNLLSGKSYLIKVGSQNFPAGSTVEMTSINTSLPNSVNQALVLVSGVATLSVSVAGDYSIKVTVKNSAGLKLVTKDYAAMVSCTSPTFTRSSLNAAGISVTGSDNLYHYSATGVLTNANGQAPYQCAWDLSGVGILDTPFADCNQTLSNQYVTYVQNRKVGLVVKDACNTAYSINHDSVLRATVPTGPGSLFIAGNISNETGNAVADARIRGVNFLSTNVPGHAYVSSAYSQSRFNIESFMTYGRSLSSSFGMSIDVSGLAGSFNLTTNPNGTIDTSNAVVSRVVYVTDSADDQYPTVTLTATRCSSSVIHARVINVIPASCTGGSTGSLNQATVEVWGEYTCLLENSGGSAMITGSFDGFSNLGDGCAGGGTPTPIPATGPGTGPVSPPGTGPGTGPGVITPIRL
ncbi:MAG: hypothetical protein H7333_00480 [Bdellovibrionales bacterium]|nr:hypothetical protein [Oligoflexia bacterium]